MFESRGLSKVSHTGACRYGASDDDVTILVTFDPKSRIQVSRVKIVKGGVKLI